MRCVIPLPP